MLPQHLISIALSSPPQRSTNVMTYCQNLSTCNSFDGTYHPVYCSDTKLPHRRWLSGVDCVCGLKQSRQHCCWIAQSLLWGKVSNRVRVLCQYGEGADNAVNIILRIAENIVYSTGTNFPREKISAGGRGRLLVSILGAICKVPFTSCGR